MGVLTHQKERSVYRSPAQTQFASQIEAYLPRGGAPLLLEGAAGLGKTRAYLAPLLASGQPVAVCVPTRALARQLFQSSDLATVCHGSSVEVFTPHRHFDTRAHYLAHKQACLSADLLICTHQAALLDVLAEGALLGLNNRYAVLFDDADQLPDATSLHFECALNAATLKPLGVQPGSNHRQTLEAVLQALPHHLAELDEPAVVQAACRGLLDALNEPRWYQTVGLDEAGALRLTHQLPAQVLKRLLTHPRLIMVSAALTVNGTFDDFQRALGLKESSPGSRTIEPTRHGQLDIVSEAWDKNAPDHLAKVAAHVATLEGAVLVLATSHEEAAQLGAMIPGATVRGRNPATGLLESTGRAAARMAHDASHVLVAAGAWSGLDTPMRWRHVVMPKAPYGTPSPLDGHAVSRYVDSRNLGARRFRLGMARGLRTPQSVSTLHLLESRFERAEFVQALPMRFVHAYQARYGTQAFGKRQIEFRQRLFTQYGGRCPISGCTDPAELEAVDLGHPSGWRTHPTAGILLRRDLHALLDAGLLEISNGVVSVHDEQHTQFNAVRVW
jgi:Rad3-related DNA helicase